MIPAAFDYARAETADEAIALLTEHGLQCGYCTPGMVMAIVSLLRENPSPTEADVRSGLEGNICRCTGYHNIVQAALTAAASSGEGASQ